MAPEYTRPQAPVSTNWPSGPAYQERNNSLSDTKAVDLPWQEFFIVIALFGVWVFGAFFKNIKTLKYED